MSPLMRATLRCVNSSPLVRIDLIGGNPVDLEFDPDRRFGIDESDAPKILKPIARLTIMYIGSSKPTGTLISDTGLRSMK